MDRLSKEEAVMRSNLVPYRGSSIAPGGVADAYGARDLASLSDAELCEGVAGLLAVPRRAPADSFVLHAPLELLARTALLPLVHPASRERASPPDRLAGRRVRGRRRGVKDPKVRS